MYKTPCAETRLTDGFAEEGVAQVLKALSCALAGIKDGGGGKEGDEKTEDEGRG